jgi:hypothetical protein
MQVRMMQNANSALSQRRAAMALLSRSSILLGTTDTGAVLTSDVMNSHA